MEGLVGGNRREPGETRRIKSPWLIRLGEVLGHDGGLHIWFLNVRLFMTKLYAVTAYTTALCMSTINRIPRSLVLAITM